MKINRRQFLKGSAAATAAVGASIGLSSKAQAMEVALGNDSYNYIKRGVPRDRIFSCSPLHSHDNPVQAWVDNDPMGHPNLLTGEQGARVVEISGVTESNRSRGRISAGEASAWLQLDSDDRVQHPMRRTGMRGAGGWEEITWEEALGEIAAAIKASEPEKIALMHGKDTSAGILGRFMDTLGSNNVLALDNMVSRRAALEATWGENDTIPDLAHTHYILNFGSNFLVTYPDYAAEALDGRMFRRAKIVTFDPRCSKTAGLSDQWVPVRPGTDGFVALAMARYLLDQGWADEAAITRSSDLTLKGLAKELQDYTLERAEEISGVPALTIRSIARQFAESGSGCVISGAGTSGHENAYDTERAIMLLPLIIGSLETRGGNCKPKQIELGAIKPEPPKPRGKKPIKNPYQFLLNISTKGPVNVLFGYNTNPVFHAPAAAAYGKVLANKRKVKLFVAIGTFRNETWELADIILPETHWLERNEPVQGSGSLLPWVGLRQRVVDPPLEVLELREILRDIVLATGDSKKAQYWQFKDTKEWMAKQLDNIPGLKQDGGWELMAKHSGVWPIYGYLHPEIRRIVDEQGEEVLPKYGKSVKMKVNPFPHWQAAKDVESAEGEFTLVVHASDYHGEIDITANDKLIMEMTLANHLHINYETAKHLNIHGGDLIRVTSKSGYLVTRAHTTQTIRPDVVAMHREGGHWSMGGIANGYFHPEDETHSQSYFHSAHDEIDDDATHNLWWDDIGVQPMDIILPVFDEKGGGAATATSVTVTKAELGDEYGTIEVDAEA